MRKLKIFLTLSALAIVLSPGVSSATDKYKKDMIRRAQANASGPLAIRKMLDQNSRLTLIDGDQWVRIENGKVVSVSTNGGAPEGNRAYKPTGNELAFYPSDLTLVQNGGFKPGGRTRENNFGEIPNPLSNTPITYDPNHNWDDPRSALSAASHLQGTTLLVEYVPPGGDPRYDKRSAVVTVGEPLPPVLEKEGASIIRVQRLYKQVALYKNREPTEAQKVEMEAKGAQVRGNLQQIISEEGLNGKLGGRYGNVVVHATDPNTNNTVVIKGEYLGSYSYNSPEGLKTGIRVRSSEDGQLYHIPEPDLNFVASASSGSATENKGTKYNQGSVIYGED
jgi:hypothetical protein